MMASMLVRSKSATDTSCCPAKRRTLAVTVEVVASVSETESLSPSASTVTPVSNFGMEIVMPASGRGRVGMVFTTLRACRFTGTYSASR